MAVDYCTFQISGLNRKIKQRFDWKKKDSKKTGKVYYRYYLVNESKRKKRNHKLKLTLKKDIDKTYKMTVSNSLRKWFFNQNTKTDLTLSQFKQCIDLFSSLTGIHKNKITSSKITKLEFGTTNFFPPEYRELLHGLFFYKKLKRWTVKETTYFGNDNGNSSYQLCFYDKLEEMYKHTNRAKHLPELKEKIYFLRSELRIKHMSKVPFFNENANTIGKLIENWTLVSNEVYKIFNNVHYIDWMSKPKEKPWQNYNDFVNEALIDYIKNNSLHKILEKFDNIETTNKTYHRKKIISVIEESIDGEYKDLYINFLSKFKGKIEWIEKN